MPEAGPLRPGGPGEPPHIPTAEETQDNRLDLLEQRLDALDHRVDGIDLNLETRLSNLQHQVDDLTTLVDNTIAQNLANPKGNPASG
jgi:hypothetical protein